MGTTTDIPRKYIKAMCLLAASYVARYQERYPVIEYYYSEYQKELLRLYSVDNELNNKKRNSYNSFLGVG